MFTPDCGVAVAISNDRSTSGTAPISVCRQGPLAVPFATLAVAIRNCSSTSIPTVGATARDLAFALRFQGHKRVQNAGEIMAEIVAKRLVEHLERTGYVVTKATAGDRRDTGEGFQRWERRSGFARSASRRSIGQV